MILQCGNCDFGTCETVVSVYRNRRKIGEIRRVDGDDWKVWWWRGSDRNRNEVMRRTALLNAENTTQKAKHYGSPDTP